MTEPRRLSPSQISRFERCPRSWKFRYIDNLPDPPGEAAKVGSFVHEILEKLFKLPKSQRLVGRIRGLAAEVWADKSNSTSGVANLPVGDDVAPFKWAVYDSALGLWDLEDPKTVDVVALEHHVESDIGGVPIRGYVDRIHRTSDGEFVVTDFKTGKWPKKSYHLERLQQVRLYALALKEELGGIPRRLQLLYLKTPPIVSEVFNDQKVRNTEAKVVRVAEGISGVEFEGVEAAPKVSGLCGWCAYLDKCPEGTEYVKNRAL